MLLERSITTRRALTEETEFLELPNIFESEAIYLGGLGFTSGITFTFATGTILEAGERLLLVKNARAFAAAFGSTLSVVSDYEGSLSNGGETIALGDILTVTFDNTAPWPELADGAGRSLGFYRW